MLEASKKFDGFYVGYFTGATGSSIGMFIFADGKVVGADAGGGKYDGSYELIKNETEMEGTIKFVLPVGNHSITGVLAEIEPIHIEVPIRLPTKINIQDIHKIETPMGPINAKFEKIRDF